MQRIENGGVIISCDFCGTDWDQALAMIEGHQGSVLCLACLKLALGAVSSSQEAFTCTLCLRQLTEQKWSHPHRPPRANPAAAVCQACLEQAAGTFTKDRDVDWRDTR